MVFNVIETEDGKYRRTVLKPKNYAQMVILVEEAINYIRCMAAGISPSWKDYKGEKRIKKRDRVLSSLKGMKTGKKLHPGMPMVKWFDKLISQLRKVLKSTKALAKRKKDLTAEIVRVSDVRGNGEYFDTNLTKFMNLKERDFKADVYSTILANSFFNIYFRLFDLKGSKMPKSYVDKETDDTVVRDKKAALRRSFKKSDYVKIDDNLKNLLSAFSGNGNNLTYKKSDGTVESFDVKDTSLIPRMVLTSKYITMFKVREELVEEDEDGNKKRSLRIIKVPNDSMKDTLREERFLLASLKEHLDARDTLRESEASTKKVKHIESTILDICKEYNFPHPELGFAFTEDDKSDNPDDIKLIEV